MIEKIINGDIEDLDKYKNRYKEMCVHCNEMQVAAEKFELQIEDMLIKKYISKFVGEELDARIEFISHHIIGIKTTNNIYGYIELQKHSFDGNKVTLNETVYEVGDKIKVTYNRGGKEKTVIVTLGKSE
jgi:exoribonuclease R